MPAMRRPEDDDSFAERERKFFEEQGPPNPMIPGVNAHVELPPEPGFLERTANATREMVGGIGREGPGGLMDLEGMRDRQRTHAELLSKFDVIGDDHVGERLPNQLTPAEYANVVQTYSDIRLGRSDLRIDPQQSTDGRQFKADAMDDIGDIMQTAAGRALIGQLHNNKRADATGQVGPRVTTITPSFYRQSNEPNAPFTNIPNLTNAYETSLGAGGLEVPSQPGGGAPQVAGQPNPGQPGVGSHTAVRVNPNQDLAQYNQATKGTNFIRSDVAMFHELTHALHDTQGTTDTSPVTATDALPGAAPHPGFATDEKHEVTRYEHQAVGIGLHANQPISENAYRRERRLLGQSLKAMPGDTLMSEREHYTQPQTYNNFFGR